MLQLLVWSATALAALLLYALYTALTRPAQASRDPEATSHSAGQKTQTAAQSPPYDTKTSRISPTSLSAELPESITNSDEHLLERGNWVQRIAAHMHFDRHKRRYNVIVMNTDVEYRFNAEGIVEEFIVKYYQTRHARVITYRIVAFEKGILNNLGDGGYINWCGVGNETRLGLGTLKFDRCDSSIQD